MQEYIDQLRQLDLTLYPEEEIQRLLRQLLNKVGIINYTFHTGVSIFRGRAIGMDDQLLSKCEYSYPPPRFADQFQRASKPSMVMFYGTFVPEIEIIQNNEDLRMARVTGVLEARSELRDLSTRVVQKIAFGRWVVKKDINMVAMLHHDEYAFESSFVRTMKENYLHFLDNIPEQKENSLQVTKYIAHEFSKDQIAEDYDYLVSSTFTEIIVHQGYDGIIFPSVRTGGIGFNVALTPYAVDNMLDLRVVGECLVYKSRDQYVVDNLSGTVLYPNQTQFQLNPIDPRYHSGEQRCLEELGFSSKEEFLNA